MEIWLPQHDAVERMGGLPPGVTASVWDGSDELPPGRDEVSFVVTPMIMGQTQKLAAALVQLSNLKCVQSMYAGVDWIAPAVPSGVLLTNTGAANARPVAEWVIAVLLDELRQLRRCHDDQLNHQWQTRLTDTLAAKRVAILGNGPISQVLQQMLGAFAATTTVFARTARDGVVAIEHLHDHLPTTDVLVVLTPLTAATTGLVNEAVLAALPDGAILVNAARGPVVNTEALLSALSSGRLRAILDVTDPEPLTAEHPLWDAPKCRITPHIAGATYRYFDNVYPFVKEQIIRIQRGETPLNIVTPV
jgi:phosphoglycerate dehydrogenase-like enzyme